MQKIVRVNTVSLMLGISKSQVWKLTADGVLKSYKLSPRVTVWKIAEIEAYIALKCEVA